MKNKEIFESIEKELKRIAEENGHTNYYKNIIIFQVYDELQNISNITEEELEELCEFAYDMYIEIDIDNIYTITNTIIELTLSNSIENILNMSIEEFEEEITF